MHDPRILVIGSINLDQVVQVTACPRPGLTVSGTSLHHHLGGKGANQAVAAARAAGRVAMVGRVGGDEAGDRLLAGLTAQGIEMSGVSRGTGPSGQAMVFVEDGGENAIVVVPGANAELAGDLIGDEPRPGTALVVLQLEIPLDTVEVVVARAVERGVPVLLNAAPAHRELPPTLLAAIDVLVVNEHEAAILANADPPAGADAGRVERLAVELRRRGPRRVVITLGAAGLVWCGDGEPGRMGAFPVTAVDTTAAGDAFCGTLAVCLAKRAPWLGALRCASAAGALAATRPGAQPSLPTWDEIERLVTSSGLRDNPTHCLDLTEDA
jgi:ribokinase